MAHDLAALLGVSYRKTSIGTNTGDLWMSIIFTFLQTGHATGGFHLS
jgi:hypothetical protein